MKKRTFRENLKTPAFRELLIIGLITVFLIISGRTMHWTEAVVKILFNLHNPLLDNIAIPLIATGFLFMIYTYRRYNEKIELIRSKERTEANLYKTHQQLEVLVHSSSAILYRAKIDDGFTLIDTTENVKQVLGYSKDEMFEKYFLPAVYIPKMDRRCSGNYRYYLKQDFLALNFASSIKTDPGAGCVPK